MERSHRSIGIDCDMEVLMHQEIVSGTLTNDPEVVHKGLFETKPAAEVVAGDASRLIFGSGCETESAHSLRVIHERKAEAAAGSSCHMEQIMQASRELNFFSCASVGTGHEDENVNGEFLAHRERISGGQR